ncbi:MAG: CmcJ/NvfI family oxidoreductase [Pseudomonadota bacterium]
MSESDVTAELVYLVPGPKKPSYTASTGGADAAMEIGAEFQSRRVRIRDARGLTAAPTLDRHGFCLRPHCTSVEDFYALDTHRGEYEAELRALMVEVTGAVDALVFDHTLRSDSPQVREQRDIREPASVVHNDYTRASGVQRLRDVLPPAEADRRLQSRFAIINVWRSIAGRVLTSPMTCCDGATIAAADLVASERRSAERTGEIELAAYSPDHRWYYFSAMQPAEVLLIKTFDSGADGVVERSIHCAFDHPAAPDGAPPRESVESRLLVFY